MIIRRLEESKAHTAHAQTPSNVPKLAVGREKRQKETARTEDQKSDTAQNLGIHTTDQDARKGRNNQNHSGIGSHQKSRLYGIIAKLMLQQKRDRDHGGHLRRKGNDARQDGQRKDGNTQQIKR